MTVETLSSNVVNYLVWRYLQEAGYAAAAVQLSKHWTREPQILPFAHNVRPRALVNILQDGLAYDRLISDVSKAPPRYIFGNNHGRPFSMHHNTSVGLDVDLDTNVLNGQMEMNGAVPDAVPRKGGRRRKRTITTDQRTNGDIMDVELSELPEISRGESEAVVSEPESPSVDDLGPPATLAIGESVEIQTEKATDLTPHTILLSVNDRSNALLTKTIWHKTNPTLLFAAGESLMRMWHLTTSQSNMGSSKGWSLDIDLPVRTPFTVTAFEWACDEEALVATIDEHPTQDDTPMSVGTLIGMNGSDFRIISSLVGTVVAIKWREETKIFITASTTDQEGMIMLWRYTGSAPIISLRTNRSIFDAVWISDTTFAVCGREFLTVYQLKEGTDLIVLKSYSTTNDWVKVSYDGIIGVLALVSLDADLLGLGLWNENSQSGDLETKSFGDDHITGMSFQPIPNMTLSADTPRFLAVSLEGGDIVLLNAGHPFETLRKLNMDGNTALAMAFSPDGFLLAVAGDDNILIWNVEKGGVPKAVWRSAKLSNGSDPLTDKMFHMQIDDQECSLEWDVDGKKLAYTVGNQIAVINFQG